MGDGTTWSTPLSKLWTRGNILLYLRNVGASRDPKQPEPFNEPGLMLLICRSEATS